MENMNKRLRRQDNDYLWQEKRATSALTCLIVGVLMTHYVILDWIIRENYPTNKPADLFQELKGMIPEFYQFDDITGAKPIITAYDYDYGTPLTFMAGSDDLLLKDENRQILDRPMTLL